jgi:hypothetical protein
MPSPCSSYPYPYPENIQSSLHILGFTGDVAPSSLKELNKRYHLLALKHHPDKAQGNIEGNGGEGDGDGKFKEINDAHKRVRDYFYAGCSTGDNDKEINMDTGYDSILQLFIKTILVKITANSPLAPDSNAIQSLIHLIITNGIQSSVKLFRNMDKHTSLMIYDILSKNQELFGISREIMDELTCILEEKTSADMVVRLNPSLLDMLLDRVYILNEGGHSYYIPLWHSELHFKRRVSASDAESSHMNEEQDISGEIIVLCEPELPDNISIDEDNNIYISLDVNIQELFVKQVLPVVINDDHGFVYYLHACDVTLQSSSSVSSLNPGGRQRQRQHVLLRGISGVAGAGGIAKWNNHQSGGGDMYKVGQRANVYANIRLHTL